MNIYDLETGVVVNTMASSNYVPELKSRSIRRPVLCCEC